MQVWDVGCLLTFYPDGRNTYGGSVTPADVRRKCRAILGRERVLRFAGFREWAFRNDILSITDTLRNDLNAGNSVMRDIL